MLMTVILTDKDFAFAFNYTYETMYFPCNPIEVSLRASDVGSVMGGNVVKYKNEYYIATPQAAQFIKEWDDIRHLMSYHEDQHAEKQTALEELKRKYPKVKFRKAIAAIPLLHNCALVMDKDRRRYSFRPRQTPDSFLEHIRDYMREYDKSYDFDKEFA